MKNKNIEDFYPLTPLQAGMLFHSMAESEEGIYVEQFTCTIKGELNLSAFKQAWNEVVQNHQILRTSFLYENVKEPVQVVHRKIDVVIEEITIKEHDGIGTDSRIRKILDQEIANGFELSKPPLMKFILIQLSENKYQFVWTYHHILLDGWSIPLIINEIFLYYNKLNSKENIILENTKQFKDYIVWLRKQDYKNAEMYWKKTLEGFTNPTPLIYDHKSPKDINLDSIFHEKQILIDKIKSAALLNFSKVHSITVNTIVHAAWAFLLGKYSRENDVLFGSTVSGRSPELEGVESMIGMLINTLPVRVKLDYERIILDWLKELQKHQIEIREYEYSSLIDIHRLSQLPSDKPIFESIIVFENYPIESVGDNLNIDLSIEEVDIQEKTNFPLNLIAGINDQLLLKIGYDANRFEASTIDRMLNHLYSVIDSFISNSDKKLSDISYLTPEEFTDITVNWNSDIKTYQSSDTIINMFEESVQKYPKSIAVVWNQTEITYRELNKSANRLARYLRIKGIGLDSIVGLFLEKSFDMIIGMLAILKAGGAYIPIDPAYPQNRIELMLKEANINVVVTRSNLTSSMNDQIEKVCIDEDHKRYKSLSSENLAVQVQPENLAYVIFTSGSTGIPKGTMVHHGGVSNFIKNMISSFKMTSGDGVLQFYSISFDASVAEIFSSLSSGATLFIPENTSTLSVDELTNYILHHRVKFALLPPAFFELLDPKKIPNDMTLLSGGEKLTWDIANKWKIDHNLYNAYGPTEASVACCWFEIINKKINSLSVPIGKSIVNVSIYLLDQKLHPVPVGVEGELFISHSGVGRGYLDKPGLTAELFLPDPFSEVPGARMYRTGDLAKYLEDGNIIYSRRIDTQIKLRGFRIELQEIEKVIQDYPSVTGSHVRIEESKLGDKKLSAFFVSENNENVSTKEIKEYLEKQLPHFMIPNNLTQIEKWPLLPNGKINYKALVANDNIDVDFRKSYIAPRTALEKEIVAMWEELLEHKNISVYDNFFDLGGHSLLAIRLAGMIKKKFNVDLSLAIIFQEPTINHIAQNLNDLMYSQTDSSIVTFKEGKSSKSIFFVHPSGGSVHWYTKLVSLIDSDNSIYGIQAKGTVNDDEILDKSIEEMSSRYINDILKTNTSQSIILVGWSFGAVVAYEIARQLRALGHKIDYLIILDQGLFELQDEPKDQAEHLKSTFEKYFPVSLTELRSLEENEQLKHVFKLAKQNKIIPFWIRFKDFSRYLEILKNQQKAWRNYEIKKYDGEIVLFLAKENTGITSSEDDLGWKSLTSNNVEINQVPGDHITMLQPPNVNQLATKFSEILKNDFAISK